MHFDEGPLDEVPVKTIDRAVLTYDEAAAQGCFIIDPPLPGVTCWRDGSGVPVSKPDGCVAVLGFPTFDWINADPTDLIPYTTDPNVKRSTPREWDVSVPYGQQYTRSAPLGGSPPPPFGFLLLGGLSLEQLTAEDSTECVSTLSNLQLHVTYTVPPGSGQPPVVR